MPNQENHQRESYSQAIQRTTENDRENRPLSGPRDVLFHNSRGQGVVCQYSGLRESSDHGSGANGEVQTEAGWTSRARQTASGNGRHRGLTLTYSVLETSCTSLRFWIDDPSRSALHKIHPHAFLRSAQFTTGYNVIISDYIAGHGRTPEEAWQDALITVNGDGLTQERLVDLYA